MGTTGLFGRDVIDRAERRPGPGQMLVLGAPRDAEVGQVGEVVAGALSEEHVGGFDVTVDEP